MVRLRRRSAAKTVAPFRMTIITSGVSMSEYISEICFPNSRTRRAMRCELIIARAGLIFGGVSVMRSVMYRLPTKWGGRPREARPGGGPRSCSNSDPDGVPNGFHLHEGGDEVGAQLAGRVLDHTLDVVRGRLLDLGHLARGAARDIDRVHVHMSGKPGQQLLTKPTQHVGYAAGQVARRQHLRERQRRKRVFLRREHDHRVAAA